LTYLSLNSDETMRRTIQDLYQTRREKASSGFRPAPTDVSEPIAHGGQKNFKLRA
jgi:hypothetical protein